MESDAKDKPVPREITALLSDERLILRETQRAVPPFGGIAVFILFLGKIGFAEAIRQHMPIRWRSPNHIDPSCTFTAFLVSVLVGARRFAHASVLRGDRALHALLGMHRFRRIQVQGVALWAPRRVVTSERTLLLAITFEDRANTDGPVIILCWRC